MSNIFKRLLTELHTDIFKPRGFKKSGQNFVFSCENGLSKRINFQKSRFNFDSFFSFTVNVEIYIFERGPVKGTRRYEGAVYCQRIGWMVNNHDKWWDIGDYTYEELYNDIKSDFTDSVFPLLDSLQTPESVYELYLSGTVKNGWTGHGEKKRITEKIKNRI
ncbi:MAG: DUF4304 domain-containing protein [Eubacterium sp.]|nr:DUF4304 domain-containing protein [Eubacterium sp.]